VKTSFPYSFFLVMIAAGPVYGAAPTNSIVKAPPVRSVFAVPTNAGEGRDPFFPESSRVFQLAVINSKTVEISSLAVKGFYRDAKGALVIINNHTFAVGDEGDVKTPGGRVHIRCLEIRSNVVVIDINGQKHELNFKTQ
jgi:hypothetical protein